MLYLNHIDFPCKRVRNDGMYCSLLVNERPVKRIRVVIRKRKAVEPIDSGRPAKRAHIEAERSMVVAEEQ